MSVTTSSSVFITFVCLSILQISNEYALDDRPHQSQFHFDKVRRYVPEGALIFPSEKPDTNDCEPSGRPKADNMDSLNRFANDPCPNDDPYCESIDDYPGDNIKAFLKNQPDVLKNFLTEDEIETIETNKFGENEVALCGSKERIIYPKKAKSTENVFEYVVNDDSHKQGVRVEECLKSGMECEVIGSSLPFSYSSACVQKYVTRSLVVADSKPDGTISGIVSKAFKFPSCCSCVLMMDSNRFGGSHGGSLGGDKTPANSTKKAADSTMT